MKIIKKIWWEILDLLLPKTYVGYDIGDGYETLVVFKKKRNGTIVVAQKLQRKINT